MGTPLCNLTQISENFFLKFLERFQNLFKFPPNQMGLQNQKINFRRIIFFLDIFHEFAKFSEPRPLRVPKILNLKMPTFFITNWRHKKVVRGAQTQNEYQFGKDSAVLRAR